MNNHVYIRQIARLCPETEISNYALAELLVSRARTPVPDQVLERCFRQAERTHHKVGIRERHVFAPTADPIALSVGLCDGMLDLDFDWGTLDAILFASSSVQGFPGVSQLLVAELRKRHPQLGNPFVLDVTSNACTSFLYAVGLAKSLIESSKYRNILCCTLEMASRCIPYDVQSYGISSLFGDAAAAMLLSAEPGFARIIESRMGSRITTETTGLIRGTGVFASLPEQEPDDEFRWQVQGPRVGVAAVDLLADEIGTYRQAGITFDWIVPHQANLHGIIVPACEKAGVPTDRMLSTIEWMGNTSSASVPFTFDYFLKQQRFRPGERVLLIGFGASFTVASAVVEIEA